MPSGIKIGQAGTCYSEVTSRPTMLRHQQLVEAARLLHSAAHRRETCTLHASSRWQASSSRVGMDLAVLILADALSHQCDDALFQPPAAPVSSWRDPNQTSGF